MTSPLRRSSRVLLVILSALAMAGAVAAPAGAAPATAGPLTSVIAPFGCAAAPTAHHMACLGKMKALRAANGHVSPQAAAAPSGYGPRDIQSAYKLTGKTSGGRTVAIVDAYNDPKAESDLKTYRSHYGLPACTTANGCFKKVNQNGKASPLPTTDYGWALEISLDLDMVSATCPDCHILLVEANSANTDDLFAAVDTAARTRGVVAVSNSYGGNEDPTETSEDSHLNHPGIAITVSSGDSGYGVEYPASSQYVTAVGGTSLTKASTSRGWTETAWSGAGSGCSLYEPKPAWQKDTGCAKRSVADVSAVADPNTGVAVYDTANNCTSAKYCDLQLELGIAQGANGWVQVGGTSASSPIIASVYALHGGSARYGSDPYAHPGSLFDVTSGSNGPACVPSYLCKSGPGYDGPTGLGTPNGTGAF